MDPLTSGLIASASHDLIKRSLGKAIEPSFSKIYHETIDELSDKHENIDLFCLDTFFEGEIVKEEANKFKDRHEIDLNRLIDDFKCLFDEQEINVSAETVLNDFFRILELKMERVPELKEKLEMEYLRDLKNGQRAIMERQDKTMDLITDFKIEDLIEKNKDDIPSLMDVLKKIQKPLNADPHYATELSVGESHVSVSYRPRSQEALENIPLHGNLKVKTSEDMLKKMWKTRTPLTFDKDSIIDFSVFKGDISIMPGGPKEKLDSLTIIPEPFPKPRPVKIFIPNTHVSFDHVLLGAIEFDGTKIKLSSVDKNRPHKFNFSLDLETKQGQFNFEVNYQTADVSQAFNSEKFLRVLKQKEEIAVKDLETDQILFRAVVGDLLIELEDDAYYETLKDLSYIQEKTIKMIPCPTELSNEDICDIKEIREIIENGRIERCFSEISFKAKKEWLKRFLREFKANKIGVCLGMRFTKEESRTIFGISIPLGSCTHKLPPVEFSKSVDEIEKNAEDILDEDFIKISLRPVLNKPCIMVFEKWS